MERTNTPVLSVKAKNMRKQLSRFAIGCLAAAYSAAGATATLDIAQVPLYLGGGVKPNIMFILDDSGSMHWELMPDAMRNTNTSGDANYMFPRVSGLYGGSDYTNSVPTVDNNEPFNAHTRSSAINNMYYDPNVRYYPWSKSDGSSYPNAVPTAAYHSPINTGAGTRNLTANNSQYARWVTCSSSYTTCSYTDTTKTFYPATYFVYNGGGMWNWSNFTKVEIKSANAPFARASTRTDCADYTACTYNEEIQNFANWYTYYRSRIHTARAGVGRAFAQLPEPVNANQAPRIGFGTLNQGGKTIDGLWSSNTLVRGVRPFVTTERQNWFNELYTQDIPASGTPLRRALGHAGEYYRRTDDQGPWNETPGASGGTNLSCRQSFSIMMTDGYWNGDEASNSAARANNDGSNGPTITGPNGKSYTYTAVSPFTDGWSNTLADVSMYYWKNDLQPGLTNDVPTNPSDPAFWQHMVTFGVGLGVNGSIDPTAAFDAISTGATITWPQPSTSGTSENIDDLLHSGVNGRGGFYSAKNPQEFAEGLAGSLNVIINRTSSAAAIATNSTRLDANTYIYQAKYDSSDWSGHLLAFAINQADGSVGSAAWDAASKIPAAASRKIYTHNGTQGVEFKWASLTAAQQTALTSSDVLDYLRGVQTKEVKNGGTYRNRTFLLGDIINSDPWFVGKANYGYNTLPGSEGSTYPDFLESSTVQNRPPMVYIGANDGMLHGFDATTGVEKMAYVPASIYSNLKALSDKVYTHKYYVDGSPKAADAYIKVGGVTQWRTVLVGSTGAGGKSVFAFDVTDPANFNENRILWEYSNTELGYTIGQPSIVRLANGSWGAIFGNGYNSTSQTARLFIVNLETGALIKAIDTQKGSSTAPNGMATPVVIDEDGDRIADYVYAGDMLGNMWKFDITGTNPSQWDIPYSKAGKPAPLFNATGPDGLVQPITGKPQVGRHPTNGLIVYFGTGKYFEVGDNIIPATPAVQSFYGIYDQGSAVADRSKLVIQTIDWEGSQSFTDPNTGQVHNYDIRVQSDYDVTNQSGWAIDLISAPPANLGKQGERVVTVPVVMSDRVLFTTLIPDANPCNYGGTSWLMEVDPATGGRLDMSVFDLNHDNLYNSSEYVTVTIGGKNVTVPVSGKRSKEGIIKTPGMVSTDDTIYKYTSGSTGNIEVTKNVGTGDRGRQSWQQLK